MIIILLNIDFIAQSFYGISQNDVGVEIRNNDTVMCGPNKGHHKGLVFWQFSSPYHVFFKYERGNILLASAITANIHSFRPYGWINPSYQHFLLIVNHHDSRLSC